jgi:hypothetical protein
MVFLNIFGDLFEYIENLLSDTSSILNGRDFGYRVSASTTVNFRSSNTPLLIRDAQVIKHPSFAITLFALRTRVRCPVSLVNAPPRHILRVFFGVSVWVRIFAALLATSPRALAPSQDRTATFAGL